MAASHVNWPEVLRTTMNQNRLFQLVISRPLATHGVSKVTAKPVDVKDRALFQWTSRRGDQEFHENVTGQVVFDRVQQLLGRVYGDLHWFADDGDYTVRYREGSAAQVKRKPPTKRPPSTSHNRTRQYILPSDRPVPFLQEIGVMLPDGRIKPTMFHKFRQINRYLEFVRDVFDELPSDRPIRVIDFGCGKSYLTFAIHHYLTAIRHRAVDIVGLDLKESVIADCQAIARKLQCEGLRFETGQIKGYQTTDDVDLAISLHACDTATDDALRQAIDWNSRVIFAVPCCQHEIARLLPRSTLPGMTEYGLIQERFAALATDALRARYLEAQGYRTQVIEFIETEHTPKNILLRAVRRANTPEEQQSRESSYRQLLTDLGLTTWHLDPGRDG